VQLNRLARNAILLICAMVGAALPMSDSRAQEACVYEDSQSDDEPFPTPPVFYFVANRNVRNSVPIAYGFPSLTSIPAFSGCCSQYKDSGMPLPGGVEYIGGPLPGGGWGAAWHCAITRFAVGDYAIPLTGTCAIFQCTLHGYMKWVFNHLNGQASPKGTRQVSVERFIP